MNDNSHLYVRDRDIDAWGKCDRVSRNLISTSPYPGNVNYHVQKSSTLQSLRDSGVDIPLERRRQSLGCAWQRTSNEEHLRKVTSMGIHALPIDTIRTLGASQVLNDATSVAKELLDNAFDAHATSIAVEISSNTLDSIQVRDNGHGIPAVDRNLVARPHCTSKISDEADLRVIGGSSLGFR